MECKYCPDCGKPLIQRPVGDEGNVPFCTGCERPWFSFCYPCVICLVLDAQGQVALIRQSYGTGRHVCVAGFIKPGESAEAAAAREIAEEIGLQVTQLQFVRSYPYQRRDNLMLGFACHTVHTDFTLSGEVAHAGWHTPEEAEVLLRPSLIAHQLLEDYLKLRQSSQEE